MAIQSDLSSRSEDQPTSHLFVTISLFLFGILGLLAAGAIITGWLPLAERINISRRDLNWVEYAAIIVSLLYGIACLRSATGLQNKEPAGLSWARWSSFISIFLGLLMVLSVLIPGVIKLFLLTTEMPGGSPDGSAATFLGLGAGLMAFGVIGSTVSRRTIPHLVGTVLALLLISFVWPTSLKVILYLNLIIALLILIYFLVVRPSGKTLPFELEQLRRPSNLLFVIGLVIFFIQDLLWVDKFPKAISNIRHPELERLIPGLFLMVVGLIAYRIISQGGEESDELRRAVGLTPGKYIRVMLAKSPSAGAIIGFLTIFLAFTMASDLFLRQASIAGILTNVSSKGVIAIGVTILMISGEFDLSVGSILGVGAMTFMVFMTQGIPGLEQQPNTAMGEFLGSVGLIGPLSPLVSAILAILLTGILGFINGVLRVVTKIPSFIVTLGTMLAFRAVTLVVIAGGRILRYRDYYDTFPTVTLAPWIFLLLLIIGLLILIYSAVQVLPATWRRFRITWNLRNNNGHFGTTTALWNGFVALFITAVMVGLAVWIVMALIYHNDRRTPYEVSFSGATVIEQDDGSSVLQLNGLSVEAGEAQVLIDLNGIQAVQEEKSLSLVSGGRASFTFKNARILDTLSDEDFRRVYESLSTKPEITDDTYEDVKARVIEQRKLVVLEDMYGTIRQRNNDVFVQLGNEIAVIFRNAVTIDLSDYTAIHFNDTTPQATDGTVTVNLSNPPILVLKNAKRALVSGGEAIRFTDAILSTSGDGAEADLSTHTRVGFFDIANGRWAFTGSEVTNGLVHITIQRDANFRMAIVWWLIFVIAFHIILTSTPYGNAVFATGGNPGAARAQGVNVDRIKIYNFILTAMLTGVAAVYETTRNPGVDPLKGDQWELEVIAMTVIGGALLSGGYGSIIGSLLGALIIGMLQTGLVLVGIDARLFSGTVGVVIIIAVILNTAVRGRQDT